MGYCVTCPLLYDISLWYYRKFQHDAACRQERMRRKCFYGWWWNEGEGRTWRTHGSVSEQKTWSDGRRQPMGCRRGGVVDTRDDGGDVAGGDVWRWVGKSAVGTGISTLSHRVSVQPSTTAEHTTVDSWALHARKTPKKTHTHRFRLTRTRHHLHSSAHKHLLPWGPQGHPKQPKPGRVHLTLPPSISAHHGSIFINIILDFLRKKHHNIIIFLNIFEFGQSKIMNISLNVAVL